MCIRHCCNGPVMGRGGLFRQQDCLTMFTTWVAVCGASVRSIAVGTMLHSFHPPLKSIPNSLGTLVFGKTVLFPPVSNEFGAYAICALFAARPSQGLRTCGPHRHRTAPRGRYGAHNTQRRLRQIRAKLGRSLQASTFLLGRTLFQTQVNDISCHFWV